MNGDTVNTKIDKAVLEFLQIDLEIDTVIRCVPRFTAPQLLLNPLFSFYRAQKYGNTYVTFMLHQVFVITCSPNNVKVCIFLLSDLQ